MGDTQENKIAEMRQKRSKAATTHGLIHTRAYSSWRAMKRRCFETSNPSFSRYGGRGITVCERWLKFENFVEDMGQPPTGMSLHRIDNDGNYEPSNVKWASFKEQSNHRNDNRQISFQGETLTVTEWANEKGLSASTLFGRLERGWAVERALTTPTMMLYSRYK